MHWHLMTTGHHQLWQDKDQLLFLGHWCLYPEKTSFTAGKQYRILDPFWNSGEVISQSQKKCDQFYENAIEVLTQFLNQHFQEQHQQRYWRLLLGPWLNRYIHVLYDHYHHLKWISQEFPDLTYYGLGREYIHPIYNYDDFNNGVEGDDYHLYLYTKVMEFLKIPFEEINLPPKAKSPTLPIRLRIKTTFKKRVRKTFNHIMTVSSRYNTQLLTSLFNSRKNEIRLTLKHPFQICGQLSNREGIPKNIAYQWDLRNKFDSIVIPFEESDFSTFFVSTLGKNFPYAYFEKYPQMVAEVRKNYPRTKLLASAYSWFGEEKFQYLAAQITERKGHLLGIQHGGNSGLLGHSPLENHLTSVADEYLVFGHWSEVFPKIFRNTRIMPSPEFQQLSTRPYKFKNQEDILFVGTTAIRYIVHFRYGPVGGQFLQYMQWQKDFIRHLDPRLRNKFIVRSRDPNWGGVAELKKDFEAIRIDPFTRNYEEALAQSRIAVIDNINTTYTQAMIYNCPTILFFDPKIWVMNKYSMATWQEMLDLGILHYRPEDAAKKVQEVYPHAQQWWQSEPIQNFRKKYLYLYALREGSWHKDWSNLLQHYQQISVQK